MMGSKIYDTVRAHNFDVDSNRVLKMEFQMTAYCCLYVMLSG